jgi:hypothetical protein
MKEITLKKSTHFISVIFNIASIIAIIVDIGAVLLLGGTLLSQLTLPGYLAKQMINAEMELVFSEWIILLVCFIVKCSCIFLAIRYAKKIISLHIKTGVSIYCEYYKMYQYNCCIHFCFNDMSFVPILSY